MLNWRTVWQNIFSHWSRLSERQSISPDVFFENLFADFGSGPSNWAWSHHSWLHPIKYQIHAQSM